MSGAFLNYYQYTLVMPCNDSHVPYYGMRVDSSRPVDMGFDYLTLHWRRMEPLIGPGIPERLSTVPPCSSRAWSDRDEDISEPIPCILRWLYAYWMNVALVVGAWLPETIHTDI